MIYREQRNKQSMKIAKRIAILTAAVCLIAAAIYIFRPFEPAETEHEANVIYTAMEDPTLPVVYPVMLEKRMAPLFGHREEKALTAGRDSLLVLPESRALGFVVEEADEVVSIGYEIRNLSLDHLIERTEVTDWSEADGSLVVGLPIQNLLEPGVEYQLGIYTGLKDGTGAWYYARIIQADPAHVTEMMALAEEFSEKTFHYESAQELTMYMETDPTADNSDFGRLTLKNSFTQLTWGMTGAERVSEPRMTIKELFGDLANISLEYEAAAGEKQFSVTENFTMKWTNQRIYMMDYERRMNEVFTGERERFSGKRILLGIADGEDTYAKKSANGRFTAFVHNRELWCYDAEEMVSTRVFAFGGTDGSGLGDLRANEDRHGVELLRVSDEGALDFLVYGRMNRGIREGWTGIGCYHFEAGANALEEQFFLPAAESFEELQADVERLAYLGEQGIVYLYMNGAIYGIDPETHGAEVVADGLSEDLFAVSKDGSRIAWQDGGSQYDAHALHLMDLNTGAREQIGGGADQVYRVLGFVGNDCVYGVGEAGAYIMSNGRVMGVYLDSIEILDSEMNIAMHYEKAGRYIRDVKVEDSRIHITCSNDRSGFFGGVSDDTLVCNVETTPDRTADIGWYASETMGRQYFVQLGKDVSASKKIRTESPKKMVLKEESVLEAAAAAEPDVVRFSAYGRGRFLGEFTTFADAADAAYDSMGFVAVRRSDPIWIRANKPGAYFMRDVQGAVDEAEERRGAFTGVSTWTEEGLYLDASGAELNQVLYFVSQGYPVLINIGNGRTQYLTGFDQGHVRVWNETSGQSETLALDTATERFEQLGNDFICWISLD